MWKDINDFAGLYEVSTEGQVRSKTRIITDSCEHTYTLQGKILCPNVIKNGYLVVYLRKNGQTIPRYVHRLVAEVFLPNPGNLPTVNHINGDKRDCSLSNLEWASYSQNNEHAYDSGLKPSGEEFYNAKLTIEDVREIRSNGKYATYKQIGQRYGVAAGTIRDVLLYRTWSRVNQL